MTPWILAGQASLSFTVSWDFAQTHVHWVSDAPGSMVGLMMTSSKRTYANMPHLPGLLLPMPLSSQKTITNPCVHRRPSDTHRQVWLSLLWGHCSFAPGPGAHKVVFVPSQSLWWVWGLILMWLHPSYCLIAVSPLSLDMGNLFLVGSNILLSMNVQQLVAILVL